MKLLLPTLLRVGALCWLCICPGVAMAYIGPGTGLSAIGALLSVVVGVVVVLLGFVWYPIKRLLRRRPKRQDNAADGGGGGGE
jgi:hypothetical protein